MRKMETVFENWKFYESMFNEKTGTIVRMAEQGHELLNNRPGRFTGKELVDKFRKKFDWRNQAFSPVPETIDWKITGKCLYSCGYCYQDSTVGGEHAPMVLLDTMIAGLDLAPYQIAIGGGSPTLHPEFETILRVIREWGAVPNYTTEASALSAAHIEMTNRYCGGVAITYHRFAGQAVFQQRYLRLDKGLEAHVQLHIHVLADKDGATALNELCDWLSHVELKHVPSIVLLAYYPVGRGLEQGIMPKSVYQGSFVTAIQRAVGLGVKVSFSEGLLPYMLSHPELGLELGLTTPMEGRFSCYLDDKGTVFRSSFDWQEQSSHHGVKSMNIYKRRFQEIWESSMEGMHGPGGPPCYGCKYGDEGNCVSPHSSHMLMCDYQPHNKGGDPPLSEEAIKDRAWRKEIGI